MKKVGLVTLVFAILFVTACRPKKDDPTPENDYFTSVNLEMSHHVWVGKDSAYGVNGWSGSAILIDRFNKQVQIDSVSLNGTNLKYDTLNHQYSSEIIDTSKCVWAMKGKNGVPDFNYINTVGMPVYTGYDLLPDSIDISQDLVIPCIGMTNADNFAISILSFTGTQVTSSFVNIGPSSFTFKSSQLSNFQKGDYAFLSMLVIRENDTQSVPTASFFLHNSFVAFKMVRIY
ncbi:MAG TPA: hypothetical protein VFF27_16535 [Bacteroidia bacterium]|nr:hypothetical protein [Bacteroidia bacterium]